ncbi:MAG: ABC transporter ATP-binding protein [Bacteroidales bacterium]
MVDQNERILVVKKLAKYFPVGGFLSNHTLHALDDVNFSIGKSEVVALVGESGSGKSTAARLIARLMPPTHGEIFYKGQDILKTEPRSASKTYRSQVQMIFQDPFSSLNSVHTIEYILSRPIEIHKKLRGRATKEKVEELLETVGLNPGADFIHKYPHELSGGQRQRVAIARVLAVDPEIILADEPISMLDVSIRMGVLNLMEKLKEERGIGYLYITHDIASARYIGDKIIVLYAGMVMESAESEELIRNPGHPYTQLLFSAVPDPHRGKDNHTAAARGEVPTRIDPLPGCPFAPRCSRVMSICQHDIPEIIPLSGNHNVRCHLYSVEQKQAEATMNMSYRKE